jgi:hypothetical protein
MTELPEPPHPDPPVTRAEFDELRAEVERLVAASSSPHPPTPADPDAFWALEGLRARVTDATGAVLFTGSVELEPGVPHVWQQGATADSLLDGDWADLVPALDALAHPVRLQLLRLVATGTRTTAGLGDAEGLGTSGQLHHHLRQLVAAGWLRSAGRGSYELPATRVVPLLTILAAAQR